MKKLAILLGTYIALSGCQLATPSDTASIPTSENEANANTTRPFAKETLYGLLLAEIAEQRGNKELAQENYTAQAKQTKDPQIAARAYQIASTTNNRQEQSKLAQLWVSAAPNDVEANKAAALALGVNGQSEAIPYLKKILIAETTLDFLSLENSTLSHDESIKLLTTLEQIANDYPNNIPLTYTRAVLLTETKQNAKALNLLSSIPSPKSHLDDIILLKVQALDAINKKEEATTLLNNEIASKPDNKNLRLNLAHRLITQGQIKEAKQQYVIIKHQDPSDYEILFALSILCLETKEYDEAINNLQSILDQDIQSDNIYFYLAFAYDQQGDKQQALTYYAQVKGGNNYLMAITNSAIIYFDQNKITEAQQLLAKTRQLNPSLTVPLYLFEIDALQKINNTELAWKTINNALKTSPKDISLIYTRALLAAQTNRIAQAERDLRYIIKKEPENSTAINALGYILTSHTTRYKEALALIIQAIELSPGNPAILDSLGWVHYKLGKLDKAEEYLRAAYQAEPDPDVAAHLGEVLWSKGDKEQAKEIWQEGLKNDEANTVLLKTIKHFIGNKEL